MFTWRGRALVVIVAIWGLTSQATARDCVVTDDGDLAPGDLAPGEPTAGTTLRSESVYTVLRARPGVRPQNPENAGVHTNSEHAV